MLEELSHHLIETKVPIPRRRAKKLVQHKDYESDGQGAEEAKPMIPSEHN